MQSRPAVSEEPPGAEGAAEGPKVRRYVLRPQDPLRAGELARSLGLSPALGQVLLNRGMVDRAAAERFLGPKLAHLTPPQAMADRDRAAERLARAVQRGERVVVFGDYDVDGTTSCAILADVLAALGGDVRALVANRFDGGYGFSAAALERVLALRPAVLVTCDCGSSDHPRVRDARQAGVDVIVVDHHLVPDEPLPALAFLNPHRPDCGFVYKGLCSAGLALSLGAAVRAVLGVDLDLRAWLDLVALGTVADVAPLDGDNRSLVRTGLLRLASPDARPGVVALREAARLRPGRSLSAMDIAFRLAPRLNAAGRLGDPQVTLDLLRARTLDEARVLAARIERINTERKQIERATTAQASGQAQALLEQGPVCGLVAAGEGWHRGVVGITAARLVDAFDLPALAIGLEGGVGHGSGRAPEGFPLFDALERCGDLLERYGGHQAAVGLTVAAERVGALRQAFDAACRELAAHHAAPLDPRWVDALLSAQGGPLPTASQLARLEPLGERNPEPRFQLERARVTSAEAVGEGHLKLQLQLGSAVLPAFGFELASRAPATDSHLRVWGSLRPDGWRGGEAVELRLEHFEELGD